MSLGREKYEKGKDEWGKCERKRKTGLIKIESV
jgi:hypothetical protein